MELSASSTRLIILLLLHVVSLKVIAVDLVYGPNDCLCTGSKLYCAAGNGHCRLNIHSAASC